MFDTNFRSNLKQPKKKKNHESFKGGKATVKIHDALRKKEEKVGGEKREGEY